MTKLKPYPEYQDIAVPWLEKAPMHWSLQPLRYLAIVETGTRDTIDAVPNGSYPFVVRSKNLLNIDSFSYDTEAILTAGDGDVGEIFHHLSGKFDVHQRVYVLRNFRAVLPRYLYYYFSSQFKRVVAYGGALTTVASLRRPMFTSFQVLVPSVDEQIAISTFLDRETAEIDASIADQKELITLLAERRAATIDHFVTNGILSEDFASRDGSHAIEAVAPKWRIAPLKELATLQTGVTLGKEYDDGVEFPYLRVANVQVGFVDVSDVKTIKVPARIAATSALRAGDVLMTEGGDRDKLGRGAIWDARIDPCLHQNHVFAVRCDASVLDARMLSYVLDSAAARSYFYQTAKQATNLATTNSTIVRNFRFAIPSIAEQGNIVDHLDQETAELDAAIADAREAIALSKERRAALISAAVTGKIDVRGAV